MKSKNVKLKEAGNRMVVNRVQGLEEMLAKGYKILFVR